MFLEPSHSTFSHLPPTSLAGSSYPRHRQWLPVVFRLSPLPAHPTKHSPTLDCASLQALPLDHISTHFIAPSSYHAIPMTGASASITFPIRLKVSRDKDDIYRLPACPVLEQGVSSLLNLARVNECFEDESSILTRFSIGHPRVATSHKHSRFPTFSALPLLMPPPPVPGLNLVLLWEPAVTRVEAVLSPTWSWKVDLLYTLTRSTVEKANFSKRTI